MAELLRDNRTAVLVWGGLMLATIVSWILGDEGHGDIGDGATVATVLVIVITFVKVRFVGQHFMELKDAPLALRLFLDGYVVVICIALCIVYVATS